MAHFWENPALARERLTLYVWRDPEGGWSRDWMVPRHLRRDPWFIIGACGGGYSPFESSMLGTREESERCAERARERYGLPVEVRHGERPRRR